MANPPILVAPTPGEPLLLYLTATTQVVSAVIIVERQEEGHALAVQRPVYFVSEVLSDSKTRYLQILKILYGVVMAQRKHVHYFRAHPITVVSSFPLGEVIRNRDSTSKVAKWALELMGHEITYAPHTAIKSRSSPSTSRTGRSLSSLSPRSTRSTG